MLNASFGVQRVVRRVRRTTSHHTTLAIQAPTLQVRDRVRATLRTVATAAHLFPTRAARHADAPVAGAVRTVRSAQRAGIVARLGHERACGLAVAAIVLAATAVSNLPVPTASASGPVGGPDGDGEPPRIVVGGAFGIDRTGIVYAEDDTSQSTAAVRAAPIEDPDLAQAENAEVSGPFLEDGTLLKPVNVDTTVADASDMLRTHKVKSGDTLVGIAKRYDVSIHTIWWANNLKTKALKVGRVLTIPPVNGLVVTVTASDTLATLAAKHKVKAASILKVNELEDPNLVLGQVLLMPGAKGAPIPTPKPPKKTKPSTSSPAKSRSTKAPSRYNGGRFAWPVSGGYISQYYHYGHYGIDIAADSGTRVKAAAGGKVIFAGWKSNGGGYQVWIAHGSGLYTTYNHMSSVTVGTGQSVGRGQQVGRVGSTGNATGPHLHFEVWKGQIWNGGRRVNPMGYL